MTEVAETYSTLSLADEPQAPARDSYTDSVDNLLDSTHDVTEKEDALSHSQEHEDEDDPFRPRTASASSEALTPEQMTALLQASLPRDVDPTKMRLAYGRHAVPKLVHELRDLNLHTRQKSLVFLAMLLHAPENVTQALEEDFVPSLIGFLSRDDLACRQKATEIFYILSCHAIGRSALIQFDVLSPLSKLFDEKDDLIRKHIHDTFTHVTMSKEGVDYVLNRGLFVPSLLKLTTERIDVQVAILDTCYNCIRMGGGNQMPDIAINAKALDIFNALARNSCVTDVKVAACRCIMMLAFYHAGKKLAVHSDTIQVLVALLGDRKSEVRAAAAGALMSITIDCDAKRIVVRENALSHLMELLDDKNELVQLNAIKVIGNCAEDYRGRFQLAHCLRKLERLSVSKNAHVSVAAKEAIGVITWRP